ncbi:adenylate/guanylate cyclase domain-containing protein [Bradyrhizobium sp. dw_78]|uniref:adenylate/guanylate cyclase domain-containing protein n=1 Tax=Bradyrhizobium sp. dw_78 TaxID=2719793 RepID=UPI001BD36ACC|nr:adenylate/guanylate cyclase domain-containing protein [Bradyrhizobium sp. dw_78]
MKRKIAAIFAADIAGYSRLVAEDEEETLRRLAAYRSVTDDFIARAGGRIFNTAGDAVLAEFASAVEAVRCAIDIQESLRTRNMAYPPSRHMSYRIGITIGDVVERDGDLLGDGVNIAARLEGLAEVGGICISRAVHEQVANKLSVQFSDIGAQEVKNIPTPVHAYMVAMRREDGTYTVPQVKNPLAPPQPATPFWMWPVAVAVVCLAAIGVGGFLYFTKMEMAESKGPVSAKVDAAATPAPSPEPAAAPAPVRPASAPEPPPPSPVLSSQKFAADAVPFVHDRTRAVLLNEYAPAGNYKAFALNINGIVGLVSGQPNEEAAKNAALEQCRQRAEAAQSPRRCEIYAVGDAVVYPHGMPPLPPLPWIKRDSSTERPFTATDMPFAREPGKARLENVYVPGRKSKAIVIGPGGNFIFYTDGASVAESVRRSLETCGALAGAACMVAAVDDTFVVPVPTVMKPVGFFRAASDPSIAADARDDVARQLAEASSGWSAVAVGASGRPGLALRATSELNAVNGAVTDCAGHDSNCRVIAIGPFTVGIN